MQRAGELRPHFPGNRMALWGEASDDAAATDHMLPGTFVHVVRSDGEWTLVKHGERQGWIRSTSLHQPDLSQADVQVEARYRLGVLETGNDAGEYTPDSHRVNIGLGSWTGDRIRILLQRYESMARQSGQMAALETHFGGQDRWRELVRRFTRPDMTENRTWVGPHLFDDERDAFNSAERALPFIRQADNDQVDADIGHYLRLMANTPYPFFGADGTISEVALHVMISVFHMGGDGAPRSFMHAVNAHFGVHTRETDTPRDTPEKVRAHTTEIPYLRLVAARVGHGQDRYASIFSMYADSPRRYAVPGVRRP